MLFSGVATAEALLLSALLTSCLLFYDIHEPPLRSLPPAWQSHIQHLWSNRTTIPPLNMPKPSQSSFNLVSKMLNLSFPSDVLISDSHMV